MSRVLSMKMSHMTGLGYESFKTYRRFCKEGNFPCENKDGITLIELAVLAFLPSKATKRDANKIGGTFLSPVTSKISQKTSFIK